MKKAVLLASLLAATFAIAQGCSSNTIASFAEDGGAEGGSGGACTEAAKDYCAACTAPANASPTSCRAPRTVRACCTYIAAPGEAEVARGTGLNRYSSTDPTLDLGCLADRGALEAPQTVTLKGFVRLFSSGTDSAGVRIEIFKEGPNGSLGEKIGSAVDTKDTDAILEPKPTWLKKCPESGCSFRAYSFPNVPTETPLVIKTSDVNAGGSRWKELYDYNILFRNKQIQNGEITHDPAAVAATDVNTVAAAAGGFIPKDDKGVMAGEVHDCGDVRLSGVKVDTDVPHEADLFYFGDNEADPLPDQQQARKGTSRLGLFGALNFETRVPIRVTAVGKVGGETVLLGTHVVQTFPGAVTALSLRGRRPTQK